MKEPSNPSLILLLAGASLVTISGCGGESRPPGLGETEATSGSTSSSGGADSNSSSGGSAAGSGGGEQTASTGAGGEVSTTRGTGGAAGDNGSSTSSSSGGSGSGGTSTSSVCGDGVADDEPCDGSDLKGTSCADVGFETGELSCGADCRFVVDACSGTERCSDGRDNDGDGEVDCADDDCASTCQAACAEPIELDSGDSVEGNNVGRSNDLTSSCALASGPEIVYRVTADLTGKLDAELETSGSLTVSIRSTCGVDASERACREVQGITRTSADVVQGEELFVVVDGWNSASAAEFTLRVDSRPANQCGDGFMDEAEQCDDENLVAGDGCDAECSVEANENEPNDTQALAVPLTDPLYARIAPEGDIDYYLLQISDGPKSVSINTFNLGAGYCSELLIDPALEVVSVASGSIVASDDDSGDGYCAKVVATLDSGDYYIVVKESDAAGDEVLPTFPYKLGVTIQ